MCVCRSSREEGARIEIGNKDGGQSNFYGVVTIFRLYFKSCGQRKATF